MRSRLAFVGGFLVLLATGTAALAADPPGRVGRLSLIDGTVSLRAPQPVDAQNAADNAAPELKDEWTPATLNYPVTSGNSLWTESGAKAELQVGPAEVRLNEQTELEVLRLDDRSVDLALHQGTANVHIGDTMQGGLLIDTPRGPVTLTRPGSYRIDVDTGGDSDTVQVSAFDGEAKVSIETPDRTDTHTVARGQSLKLAGEPVQVALADARTTAFDDWARSRDPRSLAAAAPRPAAVGQPLPQTISPVSTQMTGYQDLAPYGAWETTPNYGTVWYPATVSPDWAPYRYGHWAYVAPWGWTWIDDAPWGFTPFHYGRWVRVGPRWAWWPGHRTVRPVYAPALVAFVGGNGWSVAITSGRARPVGWVPLAPYEVYRPHYRTSATYIRNVNITTVNKTVINNIAVNNNTEINRYTNRNAVTAVSADTFARGRKVNEAKIDVSRKEIERAKATTDVRAIKPAAVAVKADQPRPTMHNESRREDRRANPAITSREQNRGNERRDPAIERRNAAIQAAPQDGNRERNQTREQRREATQQAAPTVAPQQQRAAQERQQRDQAEQQQRREVQDRQQREEAQGRQRRDQAEQRQRSEQQQRQQRDQAQEQQRQRDVQERQQRDQAEQQQCRDQQEQRQRRERQPQEQRSEQIQPQQQREQLQQRQAQQQILERQQRREAQQRQQAEGQRRADEQVRVQRQREAQEQQQREVQRRQDQDRQAREAAQRDAAREQQRQQQHAQEQQRREQMMREQRQREIAQEQQQREQQQQHLRQREQAEAQQRQQAEQQQRRAQDQQRQQRDQAQQQQRQQQEQAREEQRRRGQEKREERRERAG